MKNGKVKYMMKSMTAILLAVMMLSQSVTFAFAEEPDYETEYAEDDFYEEDYSSEDEPGEDSSEEDDYTDDLKEDGFYDGSEDDSYSEGDADTYASDDEGVYESDDFNYEDITEYDGYEDIESASDEEYDAEVSDDTSDMYYEQRNDDELSDTDASLTEPETPGESISEDFAEFFAEQNALSAAEEPLADGDEVASGTCGTNATYTLTGTGDNLTLTISGSGEMSGCGTFGGNQPWNDKRDCISTVIISEGITTIGSYAFYKLENLNSVLIPNTVVNINEDAFGACYSLSEIEIPDSVQWIDDGAFEWCDSLTYFTFPDGVTEIPDSMFWSCENLQGVQIPESVTSIGEGAFRDCAGLTEFEIPDQITYLGGFAFCACENLTDIRIPQGVKNIYTNTFNGCSSLKNVELPQGVTRIGSYSFRDCSSLESIVLPESLTTIEEGAFDSCTKITGLVIPDKVTAIGDEAFANCTSLDSMVLPSGLEVLCENVFMGCTNLKELSFPEKTRCIRYRAFYRSGLTKITLPNGTEEIEEYAFGECSQLKQVTLPKSLYSIESDVFYNCTALTDIYYKGTIEDWRNIYGREAYENIPGVTLHYTESSVHVTSVSLNTNSVKLLKGKTYQLSAKILPANASNKKVSWSSSNTKAATVSSAGKITAVAGGTATITVKTADGGYKASCTVTVVNPYKITLNAIYEKAVLDTKTLWIAPGSAYGTLPKPTLSGYYFQGWYTAKSGGTKVYSTTKPAKSLTLYAHWIKRVSVENASVTVPACTYNTLLQTPTVTVKINGKTLTKDKDYKVTYEKNRKATSKYPTAIVTGINAYKGKKSVTFKINRANITWKIFAVSLKTYTCYSNGKAQKPARTVTMKVKGKTITLTEGTDYKVTWKNNVNVGTASATFTGLGNYCGSTTLKFSILKLKKATLILDAAGGKLPDNAIKTVAIESGKTIKTLSGGKIASLPTPTRKGYTFKYWYTKKKDGSELGPVYADKTVFDNAQIYNRKIFAKWEVIKYKITFKAPNFHVIYQDVPSPVTYTVNDTVTLPVMTEEAGTKYYGWRLSSATDPVADSFKVIPKGTTGNMELRPAYTENEYTIYFESSESGIVSDEPLKAYARSSLYIPAANVTAPQNKKFDCWHCRENGMDYIADKSYQPLTAEDGAVFHFAAVWKAIYDGAAIAEYAKNTVASSTEQCAGFVSDCLIANGVQMTKQTGVGEGYLYSELLRAGFNAYSISRTGSYIYASGGNNDLIEVGDVIIFKCLSCSAAEKPWKHVGIVTKIDDGGKVYITHRNPGYHIDDVYGGTYTGGCAHGNTDMGFILMKYPR